MNTANAARPAPRRAEDLPGPRGLPVLGNLLQVDPDRMHLQFEAWSAEFGPFFKLRFGPRIVVVVGDHEATAAALRDRPDGFRRTSRMEEVGAEMGLTPGLFAANGETWKRQRRMVMAGFDPAHVRRYHPALLGVAERLGRRWTRAAQAGSSIDLQADLMRYTVDAIAGLAFGAEVNTLESDGNVIQQHLDKIFPTLFKRMMSPLPTWRWVRTPAVRAVERSMAAVDQAVEGFVTQARARLLAQPELRLKPQNLLEAMLAAADEEGSGIDDRQVAGNVLTMLLAGEDTTANTLAWLIDLLWRHPAALARATEEVRRVIAPQAGGDLAPSLEQLGELDFIEACIHETMRLKPVAPLIGLQALRDTVVGDVAIPAGMVIINVMRRDSVSESHLPRAANFEPGRWLADSAPGAAAGLATGLSTTARRTSMPFGAGPRICPGRYMALLEMKLAMVVLLGRFDIQSVGTADGQPAREQLKLAMAPVGLRMRLRERSGEAVQPGA
jgi:cytochrome P450